jgi:signal transduction histidine kinase
MTAMSSPRFGANDGFAPRSDGPTGDAHPPPPWWWWLAGAIAVAVLLALLLTAQSYISSVAEGERFDWSQQLTRQLFFWLTRAAIVPLVVAFGARARVDRGNWVRRLPLWVAAMVLFGALQAALLLAFDFHLPWLSQPPPPPDPMPPFWFAVWVRLNVTAAANVMSFIVIAVAYHAVEYYRAWRARELRTAQLEALLARSELQRLRMQLHPHFLFNALHTVSALMGDDINAARRVVMRLGDLLRLSLDRMGTPDVALEEELEFARAYFDVQQMRFGSRLTVRFTVDPDARDARIPALILQPLIENAILHGVEPSVEPAIVEVRARREDGLLLLSVRDSGPGLGQSRRTGSGLGLENTRRRLEQLYGPAHRFEVRDVPAGGVEAFVQVPFAPATGDGSR